MVNPSLEAVLERLLTDEPFRTRFQQQRRESIGSLGLTPAERSELESLDINELISRIESGARRTPSPVRAFRGGSAI